MRGKNIPTSLACKIIGAASLIPRSPNACKSIPLVFVCARIEAKA